MNVAIDGPAGAGKSTVARAVANALGYVYVDTGSMYRALTLAAQRAGIADDDALRLTELLSKSDIRLQSSPQGQVVLLNGEDVSVAIRSHVVTSHVSQVSAHAGVRAQLLLLQRKMAADKGIVMDGRDIGSQVLPDAEVKIYLTADVHIRALRRYNEMPPGERPSLTQVEEDMHRRDALDKGRKVSPLVCTEDAIVVDSTQLTFDEVVAVIISLIRDKFSGA
jgi:cytidylate kinase